MLEVLALYMGDTPGNPAEAKLETSVAIPSPRRPRSKPAYVVERQGVCATMGHNRAMREARTSERARPGRMEGIPWNCKLTEALPKPRRFWRKDG